MVLCKEIFLYAEKKNKKNTNIRETVKLCLVRKGPVSTSLQQMRNSVHSLYKSGFCTRTNSQREKQVGSKCSESWWNKEEKVGDLSV